MSRIADATDAVSVEGDGVSIVLPTKWTQSKSAVSGNVSLYPNRVGLPRYKFVLVVFHPPLPYGFATQDLDTALNGIVSELKRAGGQVQSAQRRTVGGRDAVVVRSRLLQAEVELRQEMYMMTSEGDLLSIGGDTSLNIVPEADQEGDFEKLLEGITFVR